MRILGISIGLLIACSLAGMLWQHLRYLGMRRDIVQDRQPLLHPASAFHAVTFLQLRDGSDLVEELRKFKEQLETGHGAQLVYAGKVVVDVLPSSQLEAEFGKVAWNAVVLVQHPSRAAFDTVSASAGYRELLSGFQRSYTYGLKRGPVLNLLIPQFLLAKRALQIVTRAPSHYPMRRSDAAPDEGRGRILEALQAETELGAKAVLIVNLLKNGTAEERAANSSYGQSMLGMMAEGGYGPMHMGRAVSVEGEAKFDSVALVYYPGVAYFAEMAQSTFFRGIIGGKRLGDTQVSITVPLLDKL